MRSFKTTQRQGHIDIAHMALIVAVGAAAYGGTLLLERDEFLLSNIKRVLVRLHR